VMDGDPVGKCQPFVTTSPFRNGLQKDLLVCTSYWYFVNKVPKSQETILEQNSPFSFNDKTKHVLPPWIFQSSVWLLFIDGKQTKNFLRPSLHVFSFTMKSLPQVVPLSTLMCSAQPNPPRFLTDSRNLSFLRDIIDCKCWGFRDDRALLTWKVLQWPVKVMQFIYSRWKTDKKNQSAFAVKAYLGGGEVFQSMPN
jgi:hypothetical protein